MSSIQEVECSGEALPGDTKLFSMVLYNILDRRNVAYVNRLDGECYTSVLYSACFMDTSDSRKTRLVTLVTGYRDGAPLVFGCNMSTFRMGVAELVSWFLPVKLIGMSLLSNTGLFSLILYVIGCFLLSLLYIFLYVWRLSRTYFIILYCLWS